MIAVGIGPTRIFDDPKKLSQVGMIGGLPWSASGVTVRITDDGAQTAQNSSTATR